MLSDKCGMKQKKINEFLQIVEGKNVNEIEFEFTKGFFFFFIQKARQF